MEEVDKALGMLFALSVILIFVAYYVGVVSDVKVFGGALNTLLLTATGRNSAGQFAGYAPGGNGVVS